MGDLYTTETIHGELVKGGEIEGSVNGKEINIDIKGLRSQIPAHCFKPSTARSLGFLARDLAFFLALLAAALTLESRVVDHSRHQLDHHHHYFDDYKPSLAATIRFLICCGAYPFLASLPLTGLWVLAHECGHGSFSASRAVANSVGFAVHSALMLPYFAWRSSHARHHQFANNVSTDLNYVPPTRAEYRELLRGPRPIPEPEPDAGLDVDHLVEDAPAVVLLRIVLQQVVGWPWYLLTHITAGPNSSPRKSRGWWDNSHYVPSSSLFREHEFWRVLASDLGIAAVCYGLYLAAQRYGFWTVTWTYVLPWMWVNHWIVMITYLHHTSPSLPKYTPESWTYLRGALATVDREPGFVLRHMFHHIIDLHVVHHLFPRIPHYHAQEATDAIKPLLGDYYHTDQSSYWGALWVAFTQCQWVEPDAEKTHRAGEHDASDGGRARPDDETGVLWYRPGRMPGPAKFMRS
ncbi:hypothetical protein SLS62_001177 [Diatrype stigma]|uniref:Fatty acid desaturase domain-containing protein n=1 Tax=Diatrype stigma TaxID=117547 RepID=A0AAN9V8Y2_9PEZI